MASDSKPSDTAPYQFIELLYREPVSSGTRKVGWFLTATSLIAISAIALDLKVRAIPFFPWDFSPSQDQFRMLVMLGVVGLLLAFLLYALNDVFQKKEIDHLLTVRIDAQIKSWLTRKANAVVDQTFGHEDDNEEDEDPFYESVYAALTAHSEKSETTTKSQVEKIIYRTGPLRLRSLRFWTAIGTPMILSALSLWIGFDYVTLLAVAIVNSLLTTP